MFEPSWQPDLLNSPSLVTIPRHALGNCGRRLHGSFCGRRPNSIAEFGLPNATIAASLSRIQWLMAHRLAADNPPPEMTRINARLGTDLE
jgi:hypothetical protein